MAGTCTRTLPAGGGMSRVFCAGDDAADCCHLSSVGTAKRRVCTDSSESGAACFTVMGGWPHTEDGWNF